MILFLLLSMLQSAPAPARTAALEMQTYQMIFLRAGATAVPDGAAGQKLQQEHLPEGNGPPERVFRPGPCVAYYYPGGCHRPTE